MPADLSTHTLICGSGILGLTIARELVTQGCKDIIIIEKENSSGQHASGRNSGVLHAGIYYTPDSAKARLCLEGNLLMQQYCRDNGLPLINSGKVVVTSSPQQLATLQELYRRARLNGAKVELIDEKQLTEIEPNARTVGQALFSHYTAVVSPQKILEHLQKEITAAGGVKILFNTKFLGNKKNIAVTNQGKISYQEFINAAGAYSDQIAHSFGVGLQYRLIPFKGVYRQLKPAKASMVNGSIYPVPNVKSPFLGVHFTKGVRGNVYLGPTAIPAFGRENYGLLQGLDSESLTILLQDMALLVKNKKFRAIAFEEPRKYMFKYFFADARKLVKHLDKDDIMPCSKVGIRPQLVDTSSNELVMDFLIKQEENSMHILNAISPAFTSSMTFAKLIVDEIS